MVVLAECGPWRERQELLTSDSVVWIPPTCCLSSSQLQNDKGFLFSEWGIQALPFSSQQPVCSRHTPNGPN